MTAIRPDLSPSLTATDPEPSCPRCVKAGGLCHSQECQKHVLPQLKEPSWPSMIGEGYVCKQAECADHLVCSATFMEPAPRAGCGCHSCGQRRHALKHQRQADAVDHEVKVAAQKAVRRNERKAGTRPRLSGGARLLHHMNGGYDRKRPGAAA